MFPLTDLTVKVENMIVLMLLKHLKIIVSPLLIPARLYFESMVSVLFVQLTFVHFKARAYALE